MTIRKAPKVTDRPSSPDVTIGTKQDKQHQGVGKDWNKTRPRATGLRKDSNPPPDGSSTIRGRK